MIVRYTENCKKELQSIVEKYEGIFDEEHPMRANRKKDILELKKILKESHDESDFLSLLEEIKEIRSSMKTGYNFSCCLFKYRSNRLAKEIDKLLKKFDLEAIREATAPSKNACSAALAFDSESSDDSELSPIYGNSPKGAKSILDGRYEKIGDDDESFLSRLESAIMPKYGFC